MPEETTERPEEKTRGKTFAQAGAEFKMGVTESLHEIQDWAEGKQAELDEAAAAYAKEEADAGFFGNIMTIGATLGCVALNVATAGLCTVGGLVVGAVTRAGVDYAGDAEEAIEDYSAKAIDTHYYRTKAPDIADDLNATAESLEAYADDEWKRHILKQVGDSMTAYQMASRMEKLGMQIPGVDDLATSVIDVDTNITQVLESESLYDKLLPEAKMPSTSLT